MYKFIIFACFLISGTCGDEWCISGGECVCDYEMGFWVATCENIPMDIMNSSKVEILHLLQCPISEFYVPTHIKLEVSILLYLLLLLSDKVFFVTLQFGSLSCNKTFRVISDDNGGDLMMHYVVIDRHYRQNKSNMWTYIMDSFFGIIYSVLIGKSFTFSLLS